MRASLRAWQRGGVDETSRAAAEPPIGLDAIITGALTVLEKVEPQDLYLPELAPADQERVDAFARRGRAEATLQSYKSDWNLFLA